MNRLLSLLFFVCPMLSFGQAPVLTFEEFYQIGEVYSYRSFYDATDEKSIKGAAVIWDFTNFDINAPFSGESAIGVTVWNKTAEEVPDNSFKSAATIFLRTLPWSDTNEPSLYDYLKISGDTILQVGTSQEFWKREGEFGVRLDTIHRKNSDPYPIFYNNLQYEESKKDSVTTYYDSDRTDSLSSVKSIFNHEYEGYGTILLHNGDTVRNVMKIKRSNNTMATYKKMKGDSIVENQHMRYFWYAKGYEGEIVSSGYGNSVRLSYPLYYGQYEPTITEEIETCQGKVNVVLPVEKAVNNCQYEGTALSFKIDLFSDGIIDSADQISVNSFNYSFPAGNHKYIQSTKNECGSRVEKELTVNIIRKGFVETICKKENLVFISQQMDSTYTGRLNAADLDDGSFNSCHPDDSLTFRVFHPSLSSNSYPFDEKTALELKTELPAVLDVNCDFLTPNSYVALFAIHPDGSWGECITKVVVIDTTDYCLEDGSLTKICVAQPDGTPVSNVTISWNGVFPLKTESIAQKGCVITKPDTAMINLIKPDEYGLGVSSFDLLLIRQHILGIEPFEKEIQFLAADVNNTGTITAKDLLDLQMFILGKRDFFPGNSGWRFIPKYWMSEEFDWKSLQITYHLRFDPKDFAGRPYEFTAIKVGDVSGTALKKKKGS